MNAPSGNQKPSFWDFLLSLFKLFRRPKSSSSFVPPAQPVIPPAQPIIPPAQPVNPPAQPVIPPAQPVNPPAQPVIPPAQPLIPPAQPVIPPAQPVIPPAQPEISPALLVIPPDNTTEPVRIETSAGLIGGLQPSDGGCLRNKNHSEHELEQPGRSVKYFYPGYPGSEQRTGAI